MTLSPSPDISGLWFPSLSHVKIGVAQYFSSFSTEKVKMNFLEVLCFPISILMFCVFCPDFMSCFNFLRSCVCFFAKWPCRHGALRCIICSGHNAKVPFGVDQLLLLEGKAWGRSAQLGIPAISSTDSGLGQSGMGEDPLEAGSAKYESQCYQF